MDKQHIIDEIRRTAKDNGGAPLGMDRFQQAVLGPLGRRSQRGRVPGKHTPRRFR